MVRLWQWGAAVVLGIVVSIAYSSAPAEAVDPAKIPHPVAGNEQCLLCHGAGQAQAVPATHTAFDQGTCLSCHQAAPAAAAQQDCMTCHAQPGLTHTLPSGEKLPLYIDAKVFAASIHGNKLACTDCHSSISGYPHPKLEVKTRRQYNIVQYETCKRCHFDNYTKTLDSVHYQMLARGDERTPLCTDCHGAHDVAKPSQPRSKISQTCARCHEDINSSYVNGVHGKALIEESNYDVPVCTDCHRSHTIEDPRTAAFRLKSVQICSDCHANDKLMKKYGISPNVVKTYLEDFHGKTVALIEKEGRDIWAREAVCTDCHGVHDIQRVDDPTSPVIRENLGNTCRQCHAEATTNFPSAWLSHYEPSVTRAPLVFFVRWFYMILIPFILVGLSVHILLDIWRAVTNR
ncbi:MAG: cytochrome c3 family protein [Chloroflexi bacterium]|nr:cytochrome c3 family protein [Chloroflexota bacterium]